MPSGGHPGACEMRNFPPSTELETGNVKHEAENLKREARNAKHKPWVYGSAGLFALTVSAGAGLSAFRPATRPARPMAELVADTTDSPARPVGLTGAGRMPALPGATTSAVLPSAAVALPNPTSDGIVLAQRKRIMGRLATLPHVQRVVSQIRPLIDDALQSPSLRPTLQALASTSGMTLEEYRAYFAGKQEADLLLESGGDPEARSVSDAIGVCQFLAGTGRMRGLRVDLGVSERLSRQIAALDRTLFWLQAQPPDWSKAPAAGNEASGRGVMAPNPLTRDEWIALRGQQRERLAAQRRVVDHRYDPARVIPVQTRYLLELTRRYGGVDWALQAYHGGEGGANRSRALFLRSGAYVRLASRSGGPGLGLVRGLGSSPYELLYARVSPRGTPEVFSYLYGRSDDHRHYWWKVLMAERALDLYRSDPAEFERQWQALKPGYGIEAAWYPDFDGLRFPDAAALREGYRSGALVPLAARAVALGVRTETPPDGAALGKGLRPEAMGTLVTLARLYRSQGGQSPLVAACLTRSAADQTLWDQLHPSPPLKPGIPQDPPYETTGCIFQLRPPTRDWDRKVLEYSLDRLANIMWISWRKRPLGRGRVYQIVPNPEHRERLMAEAG